VLSGGDIAEDDRDGGEAPKREHLAAQAADPERDGEPSTNPDAERCGMPVEVIWPEGATRQRLRCSVR
jgi:hypothetical protein